MLMMDIDDFIDCCGIIEGYDEFVNAINEFDNIEVDV